LKSFFFFFLESTLYAQRAKPNGKYDVIKSATYFLKDSKTEVLLADVEEFELVGDFLFATKREVRC
jgi:hypothetical protein